VAQANAQYYCDPFSSDLPLAESKEPVHRITLNCRLADGGAATLTLDPSVPKFDEFGNLLAGGKQSPAATLACPLKLVHKEKGPQLYDLGGRKTVGRLSLAAFEFDLPWGNARLLVHDKDGEVRYAVGLTERSNRIIPCHPGCFPVGTEVRVPDGTKPIERVRE